MKPENLIKKLNLKASKDLDQKIHNQITTALAKNKKTNSAALPPITWRNIMKSKITKLATAAVIIAAVVLSITILDESVTTTYALEQTIEAFDTVQFMHIVKLDNFGQISDERWIEIGENGFQIRYRQDTPSHDFLVVEDGETVSVWHKDKNTVVLYTPQQKQYQWIGNIRGWLKELAGDAGLMIEENVYYNGRKVHHLQWLKLDQSVYIDPETKLPVAMFGYAISYEQSPEGTFDIVIPDDVLVVDKRPGAEPVEEPEWLTEDKDADASFTSARYALADGDYEKAAQLFDYVVSVQPLRNWAWFWLGKAYYESGNYEKAIEAYTKNIDMLGGVAYSHLARSLAYAMNGMDQAAKEDVKKALPSMIQALRYAAVAGMFDYADNPQRRGYRPSKEASLVMMINRLRMATGQNFGYDPNATTEENEHALVAWEQWYEDSGEIQVTPDAELIPIP